MGLVVGCEGAVCAAAVTSLQTSVDAIEEDAMAIAITAALVENGISDVTVTVASLSATEGEAPEDYVDPDAGGEENRGDSAAFKAAVASKLVLGLVAQLVYLSC